ncbi:MAG TPA: hypothetical protein VLN57_20910 [Xanthobacteraceae bacterium]|nr:hypothetical protein [Xanthobacteraceae bacterium]
MMSYERLKEAIGRLGSEHEPPLGWQRRVLASCRFEDHDPGDEDPGEFSVEWAERWLAAQFPVIK